MTKLSATDAEVVANLVAKSAPHQIEISEVLNKKLTFLRQSFVINFTKDIDKKKDKEQYVETKIAQEKVFRQIKDLVHYDGKGSSNPKFDGLNKLDNLLSSVSTAIQYLRYIGCTENLDNCLAKYGMTIKTRDLENIYEDLADETVKENITNIFKSADEVQTSICEQSNTIKIDIFNELDDSLKYDAKTKKSGLKSNDFGKLTKLEAIKQKSEELAEKKLDSLSDSVGSTIDSQLNVQTVAQVIAQTEV